MNERLLKPLREIRLENVPKKNSSNICDNYRSQVANLPSTDLSPAVLHLKLSNSEVSENLGMLRDTLEKHNDIVDVTEKYIRSKLVGAFTEHELVLPVEWGHSILYILSQVWRVRYIGKLDETHGFFFDVHKELLDELDSCKRPDQGSKLILGYGATDFLVWEEKQLGEKAKVMKAIEAVVSEQTILEKLKQMEDSKHNLVSSIDEIAQYVGKLSDDIENLAYEGRADCCYTNIPWFIRLLV